jgi:uncharacterized cupin superfamily protein
VNVGDAMWLTTEGGEKKRSGSECSFETPMAEFEQLGVRIHVLPPGEPNGCYHAENQQGGLPRPVRRVHLARRGQRSGRCAPGTSSMRPPGTEHIFVGAGDEPCAILMVGARTGDWSVQVSGFRARGPPRGERRARDCPIRTRRTPSGSRRGAERPSTWDRLPWA